MQGDKIDAVFSVQRCGDGCECRGRLSLFRRCYQVKPPTTGCRHGDAMATAQVFYQKRVQPCTHEEAFARVVTSLSLYCL